MNEITVRLRPSKKGVTAKGSNAMLFRPQTKGESAAFAEASFRTSGGEKQKEEDAIPQSFYEGLMDADSGRGVDLDTALNEPFEED